MAQRPETRRDSQVALFALIWWPTAVVWAALAMALGDQNWLAEAIWGVPLTAVFAAACLSSQYFSRVFVLRPARILLAIINPLAAALTLACCWALLASTAASALGGRIEVPQVVRHPALLVIAGTLIYLVAAGMFYTAQAIGRATQAQADTDRALLLARDAELRVLRAQINPHFLFNSLHSISALTSIDAARARDMCIRLAELFRLTLRSGQRDSATLAEEIAVLRAYLAVEQIRFGTRLQFREEVDPAGLECTLPPLLLQPLVENAVKHGVATMADSGSILLRTRRMDDRLSIELENDFDPESVVAARTGVGLVNVRRRLESQYGRQASLEVRRREAHFQVLVEMPAHCAVATTVEAVKP